MITALLDAAADDDHHHCDYDHYEDDSKSWNSGLIHLIYKVQIGRSPRNALGYSTNPPWQFTTKIGFTKSVDDKEYIKWYVKTM